jgi:ABC-type glycerol-3-phosphate transport system substrate-binding protein
LTANTIRRRGRYYGGVCACGGRSALHRTGAYAPTRRRLLQHGAAAGLSTGSLSALLSACGGDDDSADRSNLSGSITYIKGPNTDPAEDKRIQRQLEAAFRKVSPKIAVETRFYDPATAATRLTTAFAGNSPPDISQLQNVFWPRLAAAGALLDITDRVKDSSFADEYAKYPEAAWEQMTLDGKIYGVPQLQGVISAYWVNEDLMDAAGVSDYSSSLEAVRDAARQTRSGNVFGYGMPTTFPAYSFQDWINYVYNAGGNLLNADGTAADLEKPAVADAFDVLREMFAEDKSTTPPGAYDFPGIAALFQAERLAICHLDGVEQYVNGTSEGRPVKFNYRAARVPAGPGGQVTPVYRASLCIAAKSKNQDAAWEYVKFLTSRKQTLRYLTAIGRNQLPVRTDVTDALYPAGAEWSDQRRFAEEAADSGRVFPPHPRIEDILKTTQTQFEKLIRGEMTGAEFVETSTAEINNIVA